MIRALLIFAVFTAGAAIAAEPPSKWDESVDVVVVGGGGAGLSAALSAAEHGASVVLVEKQPYIGGDTLVSGGYFNAARTEIQKKAGVSDDPELFKEQIEVSGDGRNDAALAKTLAFESADTLKWLEANGVHFQSKVYQIYGSVHQRSHKPSLPRGTAYVQALSKACLAKGVEIRSSTKLTGIYRSGSDRVEGVETMSGSSVKKIRAVRGVILASGGFAANADMISRFAPKLSAYPSDSMPGNTGEVMNMAQKIGASTTNMDVIEVVPEGAPSLAMSARIYTLVKGVVFINDKGERFVDERAPRNRIAAELIKQGAENCFTVADNENVQSLDKMQLKNLYRALFAGMVWKADTLKDLAEQIGVPYRNLERSVNELPDEQRPKSAPFWAVKVYPWIHYTLGGLRINEKSECLDANGKVIAGLYAAGQITGNVHGANRLGGNGLSDAIVFGRIAGRNAAERIAQ